MANSQISISDLLLQQAEQLARIELLLSSQKAVLTLEEASHYTSISKSYLYKLTSRGAIPHSKPEGKIIYFDKAELDVWLKRNRVQTVEEREQQAATYVVTTKRKGRAK